MSIEIKNKRNELHNELNRYKEAYENYLNIQRQIDDLKFECKHENAFYHGEYTSLGRNYEEVVCPDCGKAWDEYLYGGVHIHQSLNEYKEKQKD